MNDSIPDQVNPSKGPRTTLPWMLNDDEKIKYGIQTTANEDFVVSEASQAVDIDWAKIGEQTTNAINVAARVTAKSIRQLSGFVKNQVETIQSETEKKASNKPKEDSLTFTNYSDELIFEGPHDDDVKKSNSTISNVEATPKITKEQEIAQTYQEVDNHNPVISAPASGKQVGAMSVPDYEESTESVNKKEKKVRVPKQQSDLKLPLRKAAKVAVVVLLLLTFSVGGFIAYPKLVGENDVAGTKSLISQPDEKLVNISNCPVKTSDFGKESDAYKICYATRDFTPNLTNSQIIKVINAIEASFKDCLSRDSVSPAGCPNEETQFSNVQSIKWKWIEATRPVFSSQDANYVYASVQYATSSKGIYLKNGRRYTFNYPDGGEKPAKVEIRDSSYKVTWI